MPNIDLHSAMLAAALEDRMRLRMELEAALAVSPDTLMAQAGFDPTARARERDSHYMTVAAWLARVRAAREVQLRWLRASLARDMAPPWLIEMVMARWNYIPEREWDE